jgi:hypothetical protein
LRRLLKYMFIIILWRGYCSTNIYTFANHVLYCPQEAENEVSSITEERDRALQDLQSAMANNEKELAERYHYYWYIIESYWACISDMSALKTPDNKHTIQLETEARLQVTAVVKNLLFSINLCCGLGITGSYIFFVQCVWSTHSLSFYEFQRHCSWKCQATDKELRNKARLS